jgi:hydroxymethylglutaryl-CoA lyase
LVYLLEAMGYDTGVNIEKLVAARTILHHGLPGEALYGHVPDAGLPKGFVYADGRVADVTLSTKAFAGKVVEGAA